MASNGKGIDWEGITGKALEALSMDDKMIVLIGEVRDSKVAARAAATKAEESQTALKNYCDAQEKKNVLFNRASITVMIAIPAIFTALVIIFTVVTNHIGK